MKRCFICKRRIWPCQWQMKSSILTKLREGSEKIINVHVVCFRGHTDLVYSGLRKAELEELEKSLGKEAFKALYGKIE